MAAAGGGPLEREVLVLVRVVVLVLVLVLVSNSAGRNCGKRGRFKFGRPKLLQTRPGEIVADAARPN